MSTAGIDLGARLRELSLDTALGAAGQQVLAETVQLERAAQGEALEGPEEGGVVAILAGGVEVRRADDGRRIRELAPGALLAAISALEHEVELRALAPCELARIPAGGVDRLMSVDPEGLAALAQRVAESERSLQIAIHLSRLFPGLDPQGVDAFAAGAEWVATRGGDWLFREGDPGDSAYLVVSGRLRAVTDGGGEERVLNEMGAGETVGEMALLSDDVRSASVYAVRDTQLVRLPRQVFDRLTDEHPQALRRIAGFVVERLRRHASGTASRAPVACIALVGARPGQDLGAFARRLHDALSQGGSVQRLDRGRVEAALGRPDIADARDEEAAGIRLVRWLNEQSSSTRYVLYVADPGWSAWTERALRQADQVLVLANAEDGPELGELEVQLAALFSSARAPRRSLVLLHPDGARPRQTARWLAARGVDSHFHVRGSDASDVARMARLLTGRGVGVVLGGGGARGFAHLGALRALEESGADIDVIGGTSIGAIIAALTALGFDAERARDQCRRSFEQLFDVTLPLVSLLTGKRIGSKLESVLGGVDIEDLVVPYFCVATNLSRAEVVVHRRGSLFRAVRSSISLPGVLPPVSIDGDLHVDGGLLDNLPIEVMAEHCGGGEIVAIDVSPEEDLCSELELLTSISGWKVLWERINPFSRSLDVPYISSVLMRSVVVGSLVRERERQASEQASLYLKMPVDEWGLLEFEKLEAIASRGYEASAQPVRHWWAGRKEAQAG